MKKKVIVGLVIDILIIIIAICCIIAAKNNELANACTHEDTMPIGAVAPTCQATGLTEGKKCSNCGEILEEQLEVAKIECNEGNRVIEKEATNTEDGEYYNKCTMCGKVMSSGTIDCGQKKMIYAVFNDGTYAVAAIGKCPDSDIVIPTQHNGGTITTIGFEAFRESEQITSIVIPKTVTTIGALAFKGCVNLKKIEYLGTMEEWNSVRKGLRWCEEIGCETVICIDGEVEIN